MCSPRPIRILLEEDFDNGYQHIGFYRRYFEDDHTGMIDRLAVSGLMAHSVFGVMYLAGIMQELRVINLSGQSLDLNMSERIGEQM